MLQITVLIAVVLAIGWLILYMRAQKPVTSAQALIQQGRYADAVNAATDDSAGSLHKAEALKLLGRFDEAVAAYMRSDDPAAREGIALALAHQQTDLDRARRLMEETIARYPQIQEFQALGLAYIHLRNGDND
ncbi:MAG TPA: tetratricopeptide repeat protein, partial [Thermoanaerobaculia bacterium]|nr:tetratricopeptide repeat protein [Thermoanaerobaculia bacterium]